MDIKDKIIAALFKPLKSEYIRLEDEDGVSGYVVSPRFKGMSSLDRQVLIDEALNKAPNPLTDNERRRILMIAGLTPVEYEAVGARIRVHKVRPQAAGKFEILLRGSNSDAEYVAGAIKKQAGIKVSAPKQAPGAAEILVTITAEGTKENPLTKEKVVRALKQDAYIEVMPDA